MRARADAAEFERPYAPPTARPLPGRCSACDARVVYDQGRWHDEDGSVHVCEEKK